MQPSATMRVTVSTPPPAGTLTTILIGLLGKSAAGSCAHALAPKINADETRARMVRMFSSFAVGTHARAPALRRNRLSKVWH